MNPSTGTFLSVDPVVASVSDPQSLNAYAYARNNPVSYVDPTGMCPAALFGGDCSQPPPQPPSMQDIVASWLANAIVTNHNFSEGSWAYFGSSADLANRQTASELADRRQGRAGVTSPGEGLQQYADAGNVATDAQVVSESDIETITVHGQGRHKGPFEAVGLGPYFGRALDGLKEQATGLFLTFAGVVHGATTVAFSPLIYGIGRAVGEPGLFGFVLSQSPALIRYGGQTYVAGWQRLGSSVTGGRIPIPAEPVYSGGRGAP